RALSEARILQEFAQHLRRGLAADAVAVALVEPDTSILRLVTRLGHPDDSSSTLQSRLLPAWTKAMDSGTSASSVADDGSEITAAVVHGDVSLGAVTLSFAVRLSSKAVDALQQQLSAASQLAGNAIEHLRHERRAAQRERLDAIGGIAVGVAHELRNPLFGISSAAQLLRYRVKDDPVVEKNVGRILREVERLNGLVSSLLEYGQPAALVPESRDPDTIWDEIVERERGRLESRALQLMRVRAVPPARCALDAAQLGHALLHLLGNAADAAPEGSDLALRSAVLSSGAWRCELHNGGPAIPVELVPRVFEPFVSTKPAGAGFGLAIARHILQAHGGTIAIESTLDEGTTVTITLPAA
ncbi:MAG: hypothetical protein H0W68_03910, partial [Gemmatimonadaceae bacterium]|nr:hypothetical protein [Gemmatimonadaceae bacterium]